jgi:hypothetical protein
VANVHTPAFSSTQLHLGWFIALYVMCLVVDICDLVGDTGDNDLQNQWPGRLLHH